ncbi:hypothetical protein CHUAL_006293 [Chamberlinius hualienensis]
MVKVNLQLKAELENVSELIASGDDFRFYLKLKCTSCGDTPDTWQYVTVGEKTPLKGGRGEASLVVKCKLCQRENSLDIVDKSLKPYVAGEVEDFCSIITFDCRGVEPVDFSPRVGWTAKAAESSTIFKDVSLTEKEWVDYDEKTHTSVGIYNVQHRFTKSK